jgi:hypothetical protein
MGIGLSTENLWWGPGRYNSLLMSNNAPGFLHFQFHSIQPIKNNLGTFEWQIIQGRLKSSTTLPLETYRAYNNRFLYIPKDSSHARELTGVVFTWQPKWIPGLFLGSDALLMKYKGVKNGNAKMGSIFMRYAMPADQAEIYVQYGRNDKFATPFNLLADTIPRGYLGGVRKMYPIHTDKRGVNSYIQLGIEITQLSLPTLSRIKQSQSWYTHNIIRQGFTNEGQVLGSYIGPGSNAQLLEFSYIKGNSKIGIELQRWLHNADFYYNYNYNSGSLDFNRQWVDLSSSLVWNFAFKKVLIYGKYTFVRSINYEWKSYIPQAVTPENYFSGGLDLINYHGQIGLVYAFPSLKEISTSMQKLIRKPYIF